MVAPGPLMKPADLALPDGAAEVGFLCDEMLAGLGRWLRAAGYDTAVVERGIDDRQVAERAAHEGRVLLTRDRRLAEQVAGTGAVLLLVGNDIYAWARELAERLALDWMFRPFSRCLCCNTPLELADAAQQGDLPAAIRGTQDVRYCTTCDKLFWEGSHVWRMQQRLREWKGRYAQDGAVCADTVTVGMDLSDFDLEQQAD